MTWTHDALAEDLKSYLSENKAARMIWCDMQLGPAGSPRPDVYALPKSYSKFLPFAYEVKISRSDFQTDINAGKWQKYYAFASAVVFAVPDGLIKTTELPDGAGLYVRKAATWRMAKAPKINHLDNLPRDAWMKLVMDGLERVSKERRSHNEYLLRERAFKQALGDEIASLVRDRETAAWRVQNEINEHKKRLEQIAQQNVRERERANEREAFAAVEFKRLCDLFGLPHGSPTYVVSRAISEAVLKLDADERVQDLMRVIEGAERSLAAAKLRVSEQGRSAAA